MKIIQTSIVVAGAMALAMVSISLVSACPDYLTCGNFTKSKQEDCDYITGQNIDDDEKEDLLCILWDQSYEFDTWTPEDYQYEIDFSMESTEVSNSSFLLAWNITVFILFNYFVYSIIKSAYVQKLKGGLCSE